MFAYPQDRRHFLKYAGVAALSLGLFACSDKTGKAEDKAKDAPPAGKLAEKPYDHVLGDPKAPVQIVEYASLQCHHCRDFAVGSAEQAAVFPLLKEKYIDTGKVRFIFRDYPLDAFATAAAMAANCIAGTTALDPPSEEQNQRYFAAVKLLYDRLDYWYLTAGTGDVAMQRLPEVLRSAGMGQSAFEACTKNEALLNRIREVHAEAEQTLAIASTPTFFINGEKHSGVLDLAKFDAILTPLLRKDAAPSP